MIDDIASSGTILSRQELSGDDQERHLNNLERDRSILKTINKFALDLMGIRSKNELAWHLASEVVGEMGFSDCVVYFLDDEKELLIQNAAIGDEKNPTPFEIVNAMEIPVGKGITGYVAKTKKGLIIDDLEKDSRYLPDINSAGSEICVPLLIDGRLVGVIDCEDERVGSFNEFHMETLTTVAAMASAHLKHIEQNQTLKLMDRLAEREALFQTVLGASPNILIVTRVSDGRIRYCNDAMSDILGHELDAVIGQKAPDFYYIADDRKAFLKKFKEDGVVRNHEVKLRNVDGLPVWTLINAKITEVYDEPHMVAEIMDITDRISDEKDLKETHDHIRNVLEASPAGFAVSHPKNGTIEYANAQLAKLMKVPMDQFLGMPASHFYENTKDREDIIRLIQRDGSITNHQVLFRRADGTTFWGLMTLKPTTYQGNSRFFTWIHDITKLKDAIEDAEKANLTKSEFLSSMSHELRTPMNSILGFGQLLDSNSKEPLTKTQKSCVNHILRGGSHLLELIDQVLDLEKIESGDLGLVLEPVSPSDLFRESMEMIRPMADARKITLNGEKQSNKPVKVDPTRLKQVIVNLLSNAVKYNVDEGSIEFGCRDVDGNTVQIFVSDTGLGIPLEKQAELFEPFNRLGKEASTIEGTGIGLTITKKLVEAMNGHIGFESEVGRGSTFWLEFPTDDSLDVGHEKQIELLENEEHSEQQSITATVLYIEDNPANLQLVEMILNKMNGISMISAHNAELGLLMAKEQLPDLILMDINLPGMNGFEALQALSRDDRTKDIPVIAISGAAMKSDIDNGMAAGFKSYLSKPFHIKEVVAAIKKELAE